MLSRPASASPTAPGTSTQDSEIAMRIKALTIPASAGSKRSDWARTLPNSIELVAWNSASGPTVASAKTSAEGAAQISP